jgi:hypothetical protein
MRWRWLVGTAAVCALTACGTTVPVQRQGAAGTSGFTSPDGISQLPGSAPSTDTTTSDPGLATGSSSDAASPDEPGTGASAPLPGTSTGGNAPAVGAARRLPPIEIGSYYLEGGSASLAAAGFGGLVIPDNRPLFEAMVTYLNKHGGLGGRQIRPVLFKYVSGGDPHTQDAAACAHFTQDHHVFLVLGGINSGAGELAPCLTKRGVPLIGANAGGDARYFSQNHRYIYEPGQASFTRGLANLVSSLKATGWFKAEHKYGVVQYEGATYDHAVDDGLVAPLAAMGIRLTDRVKFQGTDNSVIAQGSASAVLKFNTKGIDRVIFMAPGGAAATYFMQTASTQHYSPLYGIWSADSPYVLAITGAKDQLLNASGIGYQPGLDVAESQDPTATTPAAKKCLAFWDSVGQTNHSGLNNPLQRASCDIFYTLLQAVASDPRTTSSVAALEAGYDAIGGSHVPAATFSIRFRPGSHDAVAGYRRLSYREDCSCFSYDGPTRSLG